ncbi:MAG: hypothetical protein ACOYU2_06095 [Nitrospirota bacterium]
MAKSLIAFRIFLVSATAIFMAYHTQIFIGRIEPNFIFSWAASFIIEGMLISLALTRVTVFNRILLAAVFIVSVIAASASFIVQNENLLDSFFKNRRVIEQIKADLLDTKNAYQYGQKYTTKTLQRERQLSDELKVILKDQNGDITLVNSLVFLILVFTMQSVSVYTAMTLKQRIVSPVSFHPETTETAQHETVKQQSETTAETTVLIQSETTETAGSETTKQPDADILKQRILELQNAGFSYSQIAEKLLISKSKVARVLKG